MRLSRLRARFFQSMSVNRSSIAFGATPEAPAVAPEESLLVADSGDDGEFELLQHDGKGGGSGGSLFSAVDRYGGSASGSTVVGS
jgi:hypothetical protein